MVKNGIKYIFKIISLIITVNFLLITILISTGYTNQSKSLDFFLREIKLKQEKIQTLICNIKQIKKSNLFNKSIIFIGKIYYQKPNNIRYEFKYPIYSAIIINNNYILKCTENMQPWKIKSDIIKNKLKNLNFIFNMNDISRLKQNFFFSIKEDNIYVIISMKPKHFKKSYKIKSIKLFFLRKDLLPHKLIFIDNQNNLTEIILTNIVINHKIPNKLFYKCY